MNCHSEGGKRRAARAGLSGLRFVRPLVLVRGAAATGGASICRPPALQRASCGPAAVPGASAHPSLGPWPRAARSARRFDHPPLQTRSACPPPHCRMVLHPPRCGGTCVAVYKRRGARAPSPCGAEEAHVWYAGPTCKSCYERQGRQNAKSKRGAAREEVEEASGGDILVEVLKVCGSRCAHQPRACPPDLTEHAPSLPAPLCAGPQPSRTRCSSAVTRRRTRTTRTRSWSMTAMAGGASRMTQTVCGDSTVNGLHWRAQPGHWVGTRS